MQGKMAVFKMLASGERAFLSISTKCLSVKLYCSQQKIIKELSENIEKPKIPAPPFARYYKSVWAECAQQGLKNTDAIKKISKSWGQMSETEKKKYYDEYEQEKIEYDKKKKFYYDSLTDQQRAALKLLKKKINNSLSQDAPSHSKEELLILNKPVRPLSPYSLFIKESLKAGKSTISVLASKWKNLPESEKNKYKKGYDKNIEKYKEDLKNWEMEMFVQGKTDVLRTKTLKELSRKY